MANDRLDDYQNDINSQRSLDYDARSAKTEREEYEAVHCHRVQVAVHNYCQDDSLERVVFAAGLTGCYEDDEIAAWANSPTPSADAGEA